MDKVLENIRRSPRNLRFAELVRICDRYFGEPRRHSSHLIYRTPWPGEPRVNIQPRRGMAKPYQVRQVLRAIDKLKEME